MEAIYLHDILYVEKNEKGMRLPENSYVSGLPIVRFLQRTRKLSLQKPVTFFIGENGSGKSTLLEAIAVAYGFNAEGGSIHYRFSTCETHSMLAGYLRLSMDVIKPKDGYFLRAESFYNVASYLEKLDAEPSLGLPVLNSYGGKSLHHQSHGESFLSLIENRFGGKGLYILDEPEAALSPMRQLTLLAEIHRLVENGSQFLISTHSPILMAYPNAEIYTLREDGIVSTSYRETEHFQITHSFLENPQRMLRYLFSDDTNSETSY